MELMQNQPQCYVLMEPIHKGDELPHAWAKYFKTLAAPLDSNFYPELYKHISEQYSRIGDTVKSD